MGREVKSQGHLKRWITGLAASPVLIACVATGGIPFSLLVGLAVLASLWVYFRIVTPAGTPILKQPLILMGYAVGVALILGAHAGRPEIMVVVLGLNVVVCGFLSLLRFASDRAVLGCVARQIQGVCYIPLSLSLLILLRSAPEGTTGVFLLCTIIFAGDSTARSSTATMPTESGSERRVSQIREGCQDDVVGVAGTVSRKIQLWTSWLASRRSSHASGAG